MLLNLTVLIHFDNAVLITVECNHCDNAVVENSLGLQGKMLKMDKMLYMYRPHRHHISLTKALPVKVTLL